MNTHPNQKSNVGTRNTSTVGSFLAKALAFLLLMGSVATAETIINVDGSYEYQNLSGEELTPDATNVGAVSFRFTDLSGTTWTADVEMNLTEIQRFRLTNGANADWSQHAVTINVADELQQTFTGAEWQNANLSGIIMNLGTGKEAFASADFTGANFSGATITGEGTDLFHDAVFDGADFSSSSLTFTGGLFKKPGSFVNANFTEATVNSSMFSGGSPDLTGADFTLADLTGTTLRFVVLDNANFQKADLSGLAGGSSADGWLTQVTFDPSTPPIYDALTLFPTGFDPEANGWQLVPVPEPTSAVLLILGGLALTHRRRRQ